MDIYHVDFNRPDAEKALEAALSGNHFPIVVRHIGGIPEAVDSIAKFVALHDRSGKMSKHADNINSVFDAGLPAMEPK